MKWHARLCGGSLARVLLLAALVGTGLWRVVATRADGFVVDLARDLGARAKVSDIWPVFRLALQGVGIFRVAAGRGIRVMRRITMPHKRLAAGLDDALVSWLERLSGAVHVS